jgi:DNA-directed RNA polymerase subunit RPC12/RpoP
MGAIKDEEIYGYFIGNQYVCRICVSNKEEFEVSQDELITDDGQEDSQIFCDRCQQRIL